MANESVAKKMTHGAIPFGWVDADGDDLFVVADGMPIATAIREACTLEAGIRELTARAADGLSASEAALCKFALEGAQALRIAAEQDDGQPANDSEGAEGAGEDPFFYTLESMKNRVGSAGISNDWHKTSLHWNEAEVFARVEASLKGMQGIATLLAGDAHSRIVGSECFGKFETLDGDLLLQMILALQQLIEGTSREVDAAKDRLTRKSS